MLCLLQKKRLYQKSRHLLKILKEPSTKTSYNIMYRKYFKRIFDIVTALCLLVFFFPICILVAIAIKVDSKGPVFADVPERVGQRGEKFKMYKFRSMIQNAHELLRTDKRFIQLYKEYKKGSYKLRNDPRITKTGTKRSFCQAWHNRIMAGYRQIRNQF